MKFSALSDLKNSEPAVAAKANYIKTHDQGIYNGKKGIPIVSGTRYLVQYRHPLESLTSFFEFQVRHGLLVDDRDVWNDFFARRLEYWKKFVDKWILQFPREEEFYSHPVSYQKLCASTDATMREVIAFLTSVPTPVDEERLQRAVGQFSTGWARYVDEEKKAGAPVVSEQRDVRRFRYFDEKFVALEESLKVNFLDPLGIETILEPEGRVTDSSAEAVAK